MNTSTAFAFLLSAVTVSLAPSGASAQVFKCKEGSGLVVYSDKPCENGRKTAVAEARSMDRAEDEARTADTLLRAMGPDKAIDRNGRVYYRVAGGYADRTGVLITGVAQGHR